MTTPDPTPLDAVKGAPAYRVAVERFRAGDALGTLAAGYTAQRGINVLIEAAAELARQQGRSWTEIGHALNVTRQTAQGRFAASPGHFRAPAGKPPPAEKVIDDVLEVTVRGSGSSTQHYPVVVFRLADSTMIAIVSDVWGNTGLMNASESIMAAVQRRWPSTHVLERWADATAGTTPGAAGHYAWSSGNGGHIEVNLDDLAERGLDLR